MSLGETLGSKKLEVYDDEDPVEVVQNFAKENGLSEKKTRKLEEMLLAKMEEQQEWTRIETYRKSEWISSNLPVFYSYFREAGL